MGETQVIYTGGQRRPTSTKNDAAVRIPFLREILIRSLQNAGLSFQDARELAATLREELQDIPEITNEDLENRVIAHLNQQYGEEAVRHYRTSSPMRTAVMVKDARDRTTPFSRGKHRHYLESCGLTLEEAAVVTTRLYEHLQHKGVTAIDSSHLARLTYRYLRRYVGADVADRYRIWVDFMRSDRPLLLFIMGVAGSGKSTIATELANRLDIVRTQSTDMLREVMRTMIPERLMPVLHTSSFKAWKVLPTYGYDWANQDQAVANGFLAQAEMVSVACEAVLNRALKERVSIIVEGIHVHPSLLDRIPQQTDAIVIPLMLAVLKQDELRQRFSTRGEQAPDRRAERYLEHFEAIWRVQSFLIDEANRWKVPVIPNNETEKTVQQIMGLIIDTLVRDFSARPEESFLSVKSG